MIFPYIRTQDHIPHLEPRLDNHHAINNIQLKGISEYRLYILQWASLGLAGVSVFSTLFALYWFVRMRRNFRHDLILLLIQADLFKSIWFVLFPIVDFSGADTQDGSAFCETSGFFLATGIEASDIAVLLISLHTAIYVFSPHRPSGQNGLYPYRRMAYGVYVGFPLLMASLAFVKGPTGYRNVGDACYLDATDDWHRMYLSWVPRYIIFSIIFILSLAMYIYIRILLRHFSRKGSSAPSAVGRTLPPTPPLQCHGLIPAPAEDSRRGSAIASSLRLRIAKSFKLSMAIPSQDRISSSPATICVDAHTHVAPGAGPVSSPGSPPCETEEVQRPAPVFDAAPGQASMHRFRFPQPLALYRVRSESRLGPHEVSKSSLVTEPINAESSTTARHDSNASNFPLVHQTSTESFYRRPILFEEPPEDPLVNSNANDFAGRPAIVALPEPFIPQSRHISPSLLNLITILRRGPSSTSTSSPAQHDISFSPETASSVLMSSRLRTRRQLRLLFVYPLAYLATWSLPFIAHLLHYDDHSRAIGEQPFWLLLASLATVCLQGTVDSVLFMLQVRPWRYVRRDVGFWASLGERLKVRWRWVEKSRGGIMRDGERAARVRREVEAAQEVAEREERERSVKSEEAVRGRVVVVEPTAEEMGEQRRLERKGVRNWWDLELDGIFDEDGDGSESSDDEKDGDEDEKDETLDVEKKAGRLGQH